MKDVPSEPRVEDLVAYEEPLRRLARRLLADEGRAEDALQETWLVALRQGPPGGDPLKWLRGILRNLARHTRREEARRDERERTAARRGAVPPADVMVERAAQHRELVDAVLSLGGHYSEVLLWRYFEEQPPRAIAKHLGVSVETVNTRLSRARSHLAQELERRAGGREAWLSAMALVALGRGSLTGVGATAVVGTKVALASVVAVLLAVPSVWYLGSARASAVPNVEAPKVAVVEDRVVEEAPPAPLPQEQDLGRFGVLVDVVPDPAASRESRAGETEHEEPTPLLEYSPRQGGRRLLRVGVAPEVAELGRAWCEAFLEESRDQRLEVVELTAEDGRRELTSLALDVFIGDRAMLDRTERRGGARPQERPAPDEIPFGHEYVMLDAAHDMLALVVNSAREASRVMFPELFLHAASEGPLAWRFLAQREDASRVVRFVGPTEGSPGERLVDRLGWGGIVWESSTDLPSRSTLDLVAADPGLLALVRGGLDAPPFGDRNEPEDVHPRYSDGRRYGSSSGGFDGDPNEEFLSRVGLRLLHIGGGTRGQGLPVYANRGQYLLQRIVTLELCMLPDRELDATTANLLRFALSREGQAIAEGLGYVPISQADADRALDAVGEVPYPEGSRDRDRAIKRAEKEEQRESRKKKGEARKWGGRLFDLLQELDGRR